MKLVVCSMTWGGIGCNETETLYGPDGQRRASFEYVQKEGEAVRTRDGSFVTWHSNGRRSFEAEYTDGVIRGDVRAWHEDGSPRITGTVRSSDDDVRFEFTTWHQGEHTKRAEGQWTAGQRDGSFVRWYPNGRKKIEGRFEEGTKEGIARAWYENGEIKREVKYQDGRLAGPTRAWHSNGQLKYRGTFDGGRFDKSLTVFDSEGVKTYSFELEDGTLHGTQQAWYGGGQPKWRAHYRNGSLHGEVVVWHDPQDVQKWQSGSMTQQKFKATFVEGQVDGVAQHWSADGQLLVRAKFDEGTPDGPFKRWREEDKYLGDKEAPLETKGTFKNGKIDGRLQDFYSDGDPYIDATFKTGTLETWKMWKWDSRVDQSYRADKFRRRLMAYVDDERKELIERFETTLPEDLESDAHSMYLEPTSQQIVQKLDLEIGPYADGAEQLQTEFREQLDRPYAEPNGKTLAQYALERREAETYFDRRLDAMERDVLELRFGVDPVETLDPVVRQVLDGAGSRASVMKSMLSSSSSGS